MTNAPYLDNDEIDFVRRLAEECGRLAISMRDSIEIREKTGPDDPVTSADTALSKIIVAELSSRFEGDQVISEEDRTHPTAVASSRVWLIDPIDGTKNYIKGNGQYSVMIGLLVDCKPVFGFVCEAEAGKCYYGGPGYGAFVRYGQGKVDSIGEQSALYTDSTDSTDSPDSSSSVRVIMGTRDRKRNPWIEEIDSVEVIKTGSIGLKVARILEGEADIMIHLSGKLKTWDTAGPAAIALGGNLEVGTLSGPDLDFPLPKLVHNEAVIMGRGGSLNWCRRKLTDPNPMEASGKS